jgi:cobalamin biosynthesis protein CobT
MRVDEATQHSDTHMADAPINEALESISTRPRSQPSLPPAPPPTAAPASRKRYRVTAPAAEVERSLASVAEGDTTIDNEEEEDEDEDEEDEEDADEEDEEDADEDAEDAEEDAEDEEEYAEDEEKEENAEEKSKAEAKEDEEKKEEDGMSQNHSCFAIYQSLSVNASPLAAFIFNNATGTVQHKIVKKDVDCIIAEVNRDGMYIVCVYMLTR